MDLHAASKDLRRKIQTAVRSAARTVCRVRRASSSEDDDVYKIHAKVIQNFQITYIPAYYIIVTPLARWVPSGNSIRRLGVRASLIIYTHTHTHTDDTRARRRRRKEIHVVGRTVDLHNLILYVPLRIYNIMIHAYYCC